MTTGALASNVAKDVRHRKPPVPSPSPAALSNTREPSVRPPSSASNHSQPTPRTATSQALASASSSILTFALVSVTVAAAFIFLAFSPARVPPGAVRVILIDAGSTGTRAHLFTFARARQPPHELTIVATEQHQVPTPLAALAVAPAGAQAKIAAENIFKPILDKLRTAVPSPQKRAVVPIVLRATGSLHMLGSRPAELALDRSRIALAKSGFLFRNEWARLLDEHDEGILAWTTVNYLLGTLHANEEHDHPSPTSDDADSVPVDVDSKNTPRTPQVGILELGGSSFQVVFRSDDEPVEPRKVTDEEQTADFTVPVGVDFSHARFLNRSYRVLTRSHLGFGLFDFTKKLFAELDLDEELEIGNPCFKKGRRFDNKLLRIGSLTLEETRTLSFVGGGDFDRCVAACEKVLSKYDVPAQSVIQAARGTEFYALAYFYDRTVGLGLPENPTEDQLLRLGNELCGPEETTTAVTDETCAEYAYVYSLIKRMSSNFDEAQGVTFKFVQYVNGHTLGWGLGTVLDQLPSVAKLQLQTSRL